MQQYVCKSRGTLLQINDICIVELPELIYCNSESVKNPLHVFMEANQH